MTKSDLKTGMFGRTNNGEVFAIVGDTIVYRHGGWDRVDDLDDDLSFYSRKIDIVVDGIKSFDNFDSYYTRYRHGKSNGEGVVYDRNCPTEMTISEIERRLGITNLKIIKEAN